MTAPHPRRPPIHAILLAGAGALALYIALTLAFFVPVLGRVTTQLIGDGGDCFQFVWNAWWTTERLLRLENPYFCDLQLVPFGAPLVYHTLSPIPSFLIGLAARCSSLPTAYNLMVVALYPFAGLCAFALARHITRDSLGAAAGGVVFMICPFMASKLTGHMNLLCAGLLPLYTLCLLRAVGPRGRRWRWALAAAFVASLFSNIHTTIFAANVTVWYWIWRSIRAGTWRIEALRFSIALRPVVVVCALWGAVVVYYTLRYDLRPKPFRALAWCPEPLSFVLPLHWNSAWYSFVAPAGVLGYRLGSLELAVYLGWLVLPMAVAGWWLARKTPALRAMTVFFVCALVLAAGHKLQWHREVVRIAGRTAYLPMGLYRYVPVLGSVGQSGRYMIIGYMAMSAGVAGLVAQVRRRRGTAAGAAAATLAMGLTCVDYAFRPVMVGLPSCPIPPGDGRVLDPRLGNARTMYLQTVHRRPLVGGYVARIPKWVRQSYEEMAGIGWLFQRPDRRGPEPSPDATRRALSGLDIRYVCVDRKGPDAEFLRRCGLRLVAEDAMDATFAYEASDQADRPPP